LLSSVAVPVYAEGGGGSGSTTTSGSGSGSTSGGSTTTTQQTETHHTGPTEVEHPLAPMTAPNHTEAETEFHAQGQAVLEQAKKDHKSGKTQDQLKQICEARKNGIETRTSTLSDRAQESLARINGVFTKVVDYQKANNLTVTNFDALVVTATDAQTKATASVQALVALKGTVDCTDPTTVTTDIATFKAALDQARTDLKSYRTAVKNILTAVEQAKEPSTTTGGQQ
jgi:hypothetical protein